MSKFDEYEAEYQRQLQHRRDKVIDRAQLEAELEQNLIAQEQGLEQHTNVPIYEQADTSTHQHMIEGDHNAVEPGQGTGSATAGMGADGAGAGIVSAGQGTDSHETAEAGQHRNDDRW